MNTYSLKDVKLAIDQLSLKKKDIIYVSGNLINFGKIELKSLDNLPKTFFSSLLRKVGKEGTIVFPTHSFYLVNSKKIFDANNTLSNSGAFSNYLIKKKKIYRQIHPYASISAIGAKAKHICNYKYNDVYGNGCPWEKLIKIKAKFISLGLPIYSNCTQVHFIEKQFNVPYRYDKSFKHKIKLKEKIINQKFSMFVLKEKYKNFKRNKNKIIMNNFTRKFKVEKIKLGNNWIYMYDLNSFYNTTIRLFKKNIHAWSGKKIY